MEVARSYKHTSLISIIICSPTKFYSTSPKSTMVIGWHWTNTMTTIVAIFPQKMKLIEQGWLGQPETKKGIEIDCTCPSRFSLIFSQFEWYKNRSQCVWLYQSIIYSHRNLWYNIFFLIECITCTHLSQGKCFWEL